MYKGFDMKDDLSNIKSDLAKAEKVYKGQRLLSKKDEAEKAYNKVLSKMHKLYTDAMMLGVPEEKMIEYLNKLQGLNRHEKNIIIEGGELPLQFKEN